MRGTVQGAGYSDKRFENSKHKRMNILNHMKYIRNDDKFNSIYYSNYYNLKDTRSPGTPKDIS